MRYLLLTLLVFALVVPAFAKEIVVHNAPTTSILGDLSFVYGGKGETELSWDDGTTGGSYFSNSYVPYATTFTAPADCYLVTYRYFWYNGQNGDIDSLLYADDGGGAPHVPTGSTVFTVAGNTGTTSYDWFDVDVSGEGVTFSNGDIFHPGWTHAQTNNGLFMDSPIGGSYSCWLWLGSWYDFSGNFAHMMRVVVNDDFDGPYAADQDPADGATGVAVDADILFDIQDDDMGVDSSTINTDSVVVTDDTKAVIPGSISIDDGDPNDVHVTFDPDSDFDEGVTVTVTVSPAGYEIRDGLGNTMAEDSWSFTVFLTAVESASLGEIKAEFTGHVGASGLETPKENILK
ncbi:MAG: Ig-like domain-containing protein [bacterium]|nr:Ig-like domain-containing protein [bacterium]